MEDFVFGIISLLIILPIIYFLPVGFTKKGKILILISAFIVFMIGIAARAILGVWQTGIVLILLAIGFTYILATRFGNQLFENNDQNLLSEDKVIKFELEDGIEDEIRSKGTQKEEITILDSLQVAPSSLSEDSMEEQEDSSYIPVDTTEEDSQVAPSYIPEVEIKEREELSTISPSETKEEELVENVLLEENFDVSQPGDIFREDNKVIHDIVVDPENNPSNDSKLDDLLKELELELEITNDETKDRTNKKLDEIEVEDISNSQPELDDSEIDSLQVNDEIQVDNIGSTKEQMNGIQVLNVDNPIKVEESNQGHLEDLELLIDEVPVLDDLATESDDDFDSSDNKQSQMEEIELEEERPNEPASESYIESIEMQDEDITKIESIESIENDTTNIESTEMFEEDKRDCNDQEKDDTKTEMKQLLFHTMVSQIKLSRNQLTNKEYEKLIMDHLHPQISDHDYYTFVSLLIEHYLETKKYDELSTLISQNMTRFEKYPVILQEINFLLKEYCKI